MIKLIANYSKRLGLPGYSSHQFSISCETEITNVEDVAAESSHLYETLQRSVDEQIQKTGFVPDSDYGSNGNGHQPVNRIKSNSIKTNGIGSWNCSDKQRELVVKLIANHDLKEVAEQIADEMFGQPVSALNKLQASSLIKRLLEEYANNPRTKHGNLVPGGLR
jgi:hypothetical protein